MKKPKGKFGEGIEIKWIDSYEFYGWGSISSFMDGVGEGKCLTRGCYLGEDEDYIYIANTVGENKESSVLGRLAIPRKMIKFIKVLK